MFPFFKKKEREPVTILVPDFETDPFLDEVAYFLVGFQNRFDFSRSKFVKNLYSELAQDELTRAAEIHKLFRRWTDGEYAPILKSYLMPYREFMIRDLPKVTKVQEANRYNAAWVVFGDDLTPEERALMAGA